jgi:hypothetical protein
VEPAALGTARRSRRFECQSQRRSPGLLGWCSGRRTAWGDGFSGYCSPCLTLAGFLWQSANNGTEATTITTNQWQIGNSTNIINGGFANQQQQKQTEQLIHQNKSIHWTKRKTLAMKSTLR